MNDDDNSMFKVYLVHPSAKHGLKLPKTISFRNLVEYVKKKVDAVKEIQNSAVKLFYKDGSMSLDVVDDDDVQYFIHEVCGKNDHIQKLFVSVVQQPSEVKSSSASNNISFDLNVPLVPQDCHYPTPKVEQYSFHQRHDSLPKWQRNNFKNMPMPPDAPEPVIKPLQPLINNNDFFINKEFYNKAECIFAIEKKSLIERFEYKVIKSESIRYSVKCTRAGCSWNIYTRKDKVGSKFYVSSMNDVHTCSRDQICPNHQLGGRNLAFEMLYGDPEASFEQLPMYCHNLKLKNPGTVTHIEIDDAGRFKLVFIAFGVAGRYKGTNLLAVGMDGNNQIIPIATGVSQGETGEAWTLFMSWLKECIGEVPNLAIISDRHAAITQAYATVFPNCFHGYCCRHLMMNCNLKQEKVRYLYWKCCKSYTHEIFNKTLAELKAKRPQAVEKLEKARYDKWSRAYCSGKRYNYLTSNSAESINSLTRHVRRVPITMLMEYYRRLLQDWYNKRREKYRVAPEFELTEWATKKVHHRMQWQLSGLPCGHVCAVCRVEELTSCNIWAQSWFTKASLKGTYQEMVFPLDEEANWHNPGNLQKVKPPVIKRQAGRPKNSDRFPSKNEEPIVKSCGRCGIEGHTREACMQPVPSLKEKNRGSISGSGKGKEVMQENEDLNHLVDEEYFQNGRIYHEWDDLSWGVQPSNWQWEGDLACNGEPSNRQWEGDSEWGAAPTYSAFNLNYNPESSNAYHLDDF
ncbi:transposase, MuDR, MULE transposase domain protein [Artemisia annua]|uniref:Transposase, MuDR, MULE transposase domain protein n=1 Tax=Artemisia annua TaxID=35608 RepID=A0A2U1P6S6_ARTAN|nr:transposase, MuDR, MULE transposase domain protein [Artemisia annua]